MARTFDDATPTATRDLTIPALFAAGVHAQSLNHSTPGTPRTGDGKANLAAPAPRAVDGKPDLSGVWLHEQTARGNEAPLRETP
jgi:hypothetical protein